MNALIDANLYGVEPEREQVATLVPGMPGSLELMPSLDELRNRTFIFDRDDGALNIHPPVPGPANCCDGRMVYFLVNRGGVTRCASCDAKVTSVFP